MINTAKPLQQGFSWHCYGCGKCNEDGLQAEPTKTEDGYLCEWWTQEEHVAHPGKYHHGLITTICFCHGAWAATVESYELEGKEIKDPLEYFYVNRNISYKVLKPIALQSTVSIFAKVSLREDKKAEVSFEVRAGNDLCSEAKTELRRVYATEMEF